MCEVTSDWSGTLPKSLQSPAAARELVEEHLCRVHDTRGVVAMQLLASELVTNAVLYGGDPITLTIGCSVYSARVAVSDGNLSEAAVEAVAAGHGLLLIDKIAHEWGSTVGTDAKTVWCTMPTGFLPEKKRLSPAEPAARRSRPPVTVR